jgi:retron-type reverse transcriptase
MAINNRHGSPQGDMISPCLSNIRLSLCRTPDEADAENQHAGG